MKSASVKLTPIQRQTCTITLPHLWREWRRNHAHQGGIFALLRCLRGTLQLQHARWASQAGQNSGRVESVTFSVVPGMTFLWVVLMQAILGERDNILIGDCSGGGRWEFPRATVRVLPLLNHAHGDKLDLFMHKVCSAPFVVVSDDDVFWLSDTPLRWALAQFEVDDRLAVVSLMPRDSVSSVLQGKVEQPMGSYCLIIRRDIWIKEGLSFRIVQPPPEEGYDWFYDTADFANVELLRRGYHIAIAPAEIRQHLSCLEGISTWTLKIQKHKGDLERSVANGSLRRSKAYRAVRTIRRLNTLIHDHFPGQCQSEVVPSAYLHRAEICCLAGMSKAETHCVESQVFAALELLEARLQQILPSRRLSEHRPEFSPLCDRVSR